MTKQHEIQWDQAGIMTERGLSRPIPTGDLSVPSQIKVDDEHLHWTVYNSNGHYMAPRSLQPSGRTLEEFLRLRDATPEQILRYARRWGILGICEHNLPSTHSPRPFLLPTFGPVTWCYPQGYQSLRRGWAWEPLEVWRHFARQAYAMLNIAAQLHQGKPGQPNDWSVIHEWNDGLGVGEEHIWKDLNLASAQTLLSWTVNEWLELGNVRPVFEWQEHGVTFITLGTELFGHLGVQLMSAVSRTEGFEVCSSCGGAYLPKRRSRAGELHYCPGCGRDAAQREASRRYRERKAQHDNQTDVHSSS